MIAGILNLREFGGLSTRQGTVTAKNRLYRAELLTDRNANESNAEWANELDAAVAGLGLSAVIDLRSALEKESSPSRWVRDGTAYIDIPIDDGAPGSDSDLMRAVLSGERDSFTVDDMAAYYRTMLDGRAREFAEGVRAIAGAGGRPVLVHCSAGKDRTGVLIALVLELLGVDRDSIVDDYEETGRRRPDRVNHYETYFERNGITVEQVRVMFETPGPAFRSGLDGLESRYGSAEKYLVERGGLEPATVDRLRAALLVSSET